MPVRYNLFLGHSERRTNPPSFAPVGGYRAVWVVIGRLRTATDEGYRETACRRSCRLATFILRSFPKGHLDCLVSVMRSHEQTLDLSCSPPCEGPQLQQEISSQFLRRLENMSDPQLLEFRPVERLGAQRHP